MLAVDDFTKAALARLSKLRDILQSPRVNLHNDLQHTETEQYSGFASAFVIRIGNGT